MGAWTINLGTVKVLKFYLGKERGRKGGEGKEREIRNEGRRRKED
jgi:hypothetical protein